MRPPFYVRQLKRDLEVWIAKGLVREESREAILAGVGVGSRRLDVMLAIFGVVLIGAGAMSFVAANWAAMEKLTRLIVLFGSMWAAYGVALWLLAKNREAFGQAFVLLGVILFGVNIWFVAQTYNINAHYPDGTLMWGVGALAAAALVPSRSALSLAIVLGCLWSWQETEYFQSSAHLAYLPFWAISAFLAWRLNWRPAVHLAALALLFWLAISVEGLTRMSGSSEAGVLAIYILVSVGLWCVLQLVDLDENGLTATASHYLLLVFLGSFGLLHHVDMGRHLPGVAWISVALLSAIASIAVLVAGAARKVFSSLDMFAIGFAGISAVFYVFAAIRFGHRLDVPYDVCTLLVIMWSLSRGTRTDDRFVINLSITAFGIWFLDAYFELFAGWVDKALFFTIGGVLLVGLGLGLETFRRRLIGTRGAPP